MATKSTKSAKGLRKERAKSAPATARSGVPPHPGNRIEVDAIDDVAVASVEIAIRRASDNAELERGPAVPIMGKWHYTATLPLQSGDEVVVEAIATDHPGNQARLERPFRRP